MAVYTTVDDAGLFFNPLLYTGTGAELAITGVGFQPDLVWLKNRDATDEHNVINSVSGATKYLVPDAIDAEVTDAQNLKSFDSDGFTIGTSNTINTNTEKFVSWNWKAGTTAVPSGGSITPGSCSLTTTAGFGIFRYTGNAVAGANIAHGLGAAPTFMIFKNWQYTGTWSIYHQGVGNTKAMVLNTNAAATTSDQYFDDTSPTTTLWYMGPHGSVNGSGDGLVSYIFTDIKGYSSFGKYWGNGNADGPFLYTGFKPAFVLIKAFSGTGFWQLIDNKRPGYNPESYALSPNSNDAENTSDDVADLLSNGFKLMSSSTYSNGDGTDYLFAAFAENPFVNSNGVPGNSYFQPG